MKNKIYLGLGSNLGRRFDHLDKAINDLLKIGVLRGRSSIYESDPIGFESGHRFLNMVVLLETDFNPKALLKFTQLIEMKHLRKTSSKNYTDRTLDIDILFFNNQLIDEISIQIPHPSIQERAFVLAPMMELQPEYMHPKTNKTIAELYLNCKGLKDLRLYHP